MDEDDQIAQIVAITGAEPDAARHLLEAANGQVEAAVQLHFDGGVGHNDDFEDASEALVRQLATGTGPAEPGGNMPSAGGPLDEMMDGTRRPDEVRRERLYDGPAGGGGMGGMFAMGGGMMGMHMPRGPPAQVDMPFRNFREEEDDMDDDAGPSARLADMYRPPSELFATGTIKQLQQEAETDDKWLLINVQSNEEFASHQLNADLWGDSMIKEIVKGNFCFAQRTMPQPEAQLVVNTYSVVELPAIIIVDPHTGQKMMQWTGRVGKERFMEDILPFLDIAPSHPSAGSLMGATLQQQTFQKTTAPAPVGLAGVSGVTHEDEEMHKAIAESLASAGSTGAGNPGGGASASGRAGAAPMTIDDDEDALLAHVLRESARSAAAEAGPSGGSGVHSIPGSDSNDGDADLDAADLAGEAAPSAPPAPSAG